MYREVEIKLRPDQIENEEAIRSAIAKRSKLRGAFTYRLLRRSIDARGHQPVFRLRVGVASNEPLPPIEPYRADYQQADDSAPVHIIGAGPAGYFAALECLELGLKPIVLDRGKDVQLRRRDLRAIQQFGEVNPHSNYCFGEGGAGTYSDGKLYTRSHKRGSIRKVLYQLHEHGASDDILLDAHPHIGSNKLPKIIAQMRETIEAHGGEVRFETFVTDLIVEEGIVRQIVLESGETIPAQHVILATGHSAHDIYELFASKGWALEAKPFALGVRIEHPQGIIDRQQYNQDPRHDNLPAASYKLVTQVERKGVFSFCMCPGGLIVPAATAPGELVVNGMSLSRRDSPYANSGFVTEVNENDWAEFADHGPLAGLRYQETVEKRIFDAGDGSQKAPAQRIPDFLAGRLSPKLNPTSYIPGIYAAPLHELLPKPVATRLAKGLEQLGKRVKGYLSDKGQLIGVESRTSSPVRIPRNRETLEHPDVRGLFPCGEGAGFAGGILSAAMDGQRVARAVAASAIESASEEL